MYVRCEACGKRFYKYNYSQVKLCNSCWDRKRKRNYHPRKERSKKYVCEACGKRFAFQSNLTYHKTKECVEKVLNEARGISK